MTVLSNARDSTRLRITPRPVLRTAARTLTVGMTLAIALLSGCATQQQQRMQQETAMVRAAASSDYKGRFSVNYADQNGRIQNAYGNFEWVEQADAVTLSLRSPLGSTLAIISATPTNATLELPNKAPRTAANVEDLMRDSLGFPLPVNGMREWLKNRPSSTSRAQITRDDRGRITELVQDGWKIDYLSFDDNVPPTPPAQATLPPSGSTGVNGAVGIPTPQTVPVVVRLMNLTRLHTPRDAPLSVRLVINP